ncbi:Class IV adenylate cyclase [Sulfidibacter corallicola]|uniref:Class IV adenylate cyclase n=1 Tax=Sulfidibacter corallicola TaxID=2818388 RepID=A0A8A4TRI4_SULCO|nr:class IV adenylate cyclase [Sulfidibacter corallicola]QTD52007.1 class IV adenylate cyclase [Sulfidibacter corallicola]
MATNIEIKAHARDFDMQKRLAADLAGKDPVTIYQKDIFFKVPHGRLKLRIFDDNHGELIAYERSDLQGPRTSEYQICPSEDPDALTQTLSQALEIRGIVEKNRLLYWVGHTRIHLDDVVGLGKFIELEVVMQPGQTADQGEKIAEGLMAKLGIAPADLIPVAYIDLL